MGKPPRPRDQRRLRNHFLIARPPLLAVMQGGELRELRGIALDSNLFTAPMTAANSARSRNSRPKKLVPRNWAIA
ncbi:MAG: hypothetical protein DMG13_10030 [Acidobacteria bacterium]|nr:MAG: hypothetical protein DMG13_10030 [Acidobacteriota bacterium]